MQNDALKNWEKATQDLADYFVKKYFWAVPTDEYWIAKKVGGCLSINDRFFNLSDIVDFIRYKYTEKQMFAYYDYSLETRLKNESPINIKNWKKTYAKK